MIEAEVADREHLTSELQVHEATWEDGERLSVAWLGGWRVRNGFRRNGYSNALMTTPGSAMSVFGIRTYWYVRTRNTNALGFIAP